MTYQELMDKYGLSQNKQKALTTNGLLSKYHYQAPGMLIKMIRAWGQEPMKIRFVTRQNSGSWGPWYHWSKQIQNPVTNKWIFLEECGRTGKNNYLDSEAEIKIIV